jgi:excisionase family DNA binding protein
MDWERKNEPSPSRLTCVAYIKGKSVAKTISRIAKQIFPPKYMNTEHNQQSPEPLLTPIQVTFLTQAELAKALGVCRQTIVRWTQSEFIPAIRIGNKSVRYDLAEVRAHLISQSKVERIEQELRDETTKHN